MRRSPPLFRHTSTRLFSLSTPLCAVKNYYDILGVSKSASGKEIKAAYYKLAKKYHPDTNKDKNAQKKFQEVSEAYEILSDKNHRQQYDSFGTTDAAFGSQTGPSGPHPGAGAGFGGFEASIDPEELFRSIFGDFSQAQGRRAGKSGHASSPFDDLFGGAGEQWASTPRHGHSPTEEIIMDLTFEEAARGLSKTISVRVAGLCGRCDGTRCEMGTKPIRCPNCNGTGMETVSTGPFVMRTTCRQCKGTAEFIKHKCYECEGTGRTVQTRRISIPVPAGVEDGQTVRVAAESKEVFITFRIQRDAYFRRQGADVHTDVDITLSQGALGGAARVRGIYEAINLKIPPGTSSHTVIRLQGKGIRRVHSHGYGDHLVHVRVRMPTALSDKQRALLAAYAELENDTAGSVDGMADTSSGGRQATYADGLLDFLRRILHAGPPPAETTSASDANESSDPKRGRRDSDSGTR